jgi:hypothetical protein
MIAFMTFYVNLPISNPMYDADRRISKPTVLPLITVKQIS